MGCWGIEVVTRRCIRSNVSIDQATDCAPRRAPRVPPRKRREKGGHNRAWPSPRSVGNAVYTKASVRVSV